MLAGRLTTSGDDRLHAGHGRLQGSPGRHFNPRYKLGVADPLVGRVEAEVDPGVRQIVVLRFRQALVVELQQGGEGEQGRGG